MKYLILLLISMNCFAADYTEALDKSKDAFLIQSGITQYTQRFYNYTRQQALLYARKLDIEKELIFSLSAFNIYRAKEIKLNITSNKDIILNTNSINLVMRF